MPAIPVTITFIALYALALVPMTGWIGLYRGNINVLRADGGDSVLFKRIRVHGNLTENAPVMAMALGASELLGLPSWALWIAVCSFVIGRVLHFKLYDSKSRAVAMLLTQLAAALPAAWCLYVIYVV